MQRNKEITLHEAMSRVVDKLGTVTVPQMAWVLNNSRLYTKKDNSEIKPCQIHARVSKYPELFKIENNCVVKVN